MKTLLNTFVLIGASAMAIAGDLETIRARVVAIGIPGVSAVAPVGTFLPGGPIHDKPAFATSPSQARSWTRRGFSSAACPILGSR